jgi:hypothetical protein
LISTSKAEKFSKSNDCLVGFKVFRKELVRLILVNGWEKRNPTHGSGWMVQVLSTEQEGCIFLIPPTAVGGYFKSRLFIASLRFATQ